MAYIDGVKLLIGLNDDKQDNQLQKIIDVTERRMISLLPKDVKEVPESLEWVVEEVAVKRYNRIGAEGMSSESIDGRSTKFQENDFDEYMSIIEDAYPSVSSTKGSIKFY